MSPSRSDAKELGQSPSGLVRIAVQALLGGLAFFALGILAALSVVGHEPVAGAVIFSAIGIVLLALASRLGALARTSREIGTKLVPSEHVLAVATGVESDLLSSSRVLVATDDDVIALHARLIRRPREVGRIAYADVTGYKPTRLGLELRGSDLNLSVNRALPSQVEALASCIRARCP